jgi:predicted alpha/beta superfamily hydrolase
VLEEPNLKGVVMPTRLCLLVLLLVALTCSTISSALGQTRESPPSSSPFEIPRTQIKRITSSIGGQEYVLDVYLPPGYADASKRFPVLYLLDAQWDFPLVVGLFETQWEDGFVPPMIIVGITWGGTNPDYGYLRFKDLTPTNNPRFPQSGNAPNFLTFLKRELIPFIDSNYRTVGNDRLLMGNSLGGTFGLYALFNEPTLFTRYVLSSPNLTFGKGISAYEKEYAAKNSVLPVRLFICVGELEGPHVTQLKDFVTTVSARNYQRLDLQTLIVKGVGHSSNKPEGFVKGLQAVFAPSPVSIAPSILDQYVGTYQFPGYTEEIVREKDQLFLIIPEGTKFLLNPQSERDFYVRGFYMIAHFKSNDAGKITGFEVEQSSGTRQYVEKIR